MNYKELVYSLNKIGIALSSEKNLYKLLEFMVNEITLFADCDACSLYLREYEPDRLIFETTKTLSMKNSTKKFKAFPIPLEKTSIAGYTAVTGEIVNIDDCYNIDPSKEYSFDSSFDKRVGYKTKSMLAVPMIDHKGKIIGVIQLINRFEKEVSIFDIENIEELQTRGIIPFSSEFIEIITSLASQAAIAISNIRLLEDNKNLYRALVHSFSEAIEARSPHTAGHSKRVTFISSLIAKKINSIDTGFFKNTFFTDDELEELKFSALLHDVGKVSVKEKILEKANKLSDEQIDVIKERYNSIKFSIKLESTDYEKEELSLIEANDELDFILKINVPGFLSDDDLERINNISKKRYLNVENIEQKYLSQIELDLLKIRKGSFAPEEMKQMQQHVVYTTEILKPIKFTEELKNVSVYAASHHEMLDGSGYPNKLKAGDIPLQSRILAIADIFEALTANDRPYKKAMPLKKSLSILQEDAERGKLDSNIVNLFIKDKVYKQYIESRDIV